MRCYEKVIFKDLLLFSFVFMYFSSNINNRKKTKENQLKGKQRKKTKMNKDKVFFYDDFSFHPPSPLQVISLQQPDGPEAGASVLGYRFTGGTSVILY